MGVKEARMRTCYSRVMSHQAYDYTSRDIPRLSAFSDAIFAIALTLPVLELRFPDPSQSIQAQLPEVWPAFVAYLVTFFVGVRQWRVHYGLFDRVTTVDQGAVNRNSLFLFVFSLLPFTTSTVMGHGREVLAVVIYALNLAALSFLLVLLETWLLKRGFVDSEAVPKTRRSVRLSTGTGCLFILQALLGLVQPRLSLFVPLALPLVFRLVDGLEQRDTRDTTA